MLNFDYIALYYFLLLSCLAFGLRTVWWLDIYLIPVYLYAVTVAHFPGLIKFKSPGLLLATQNQQNLFIALIIGFVLIIKSSINVDKIKKFLGYAGFLNLIAFVLFFKLGNENPPLFMIPYSLGMELFQPQNTDEFMLWAKGFEYNSLIQNVSMSGVMNLALAPFSYLLIKSKKKKVLFIALQVICAFLCKSSVPALALCFIALFWLGKDAWCLGLFIVMFVWWMTPEQFNDGGRFNMYRHFLGTLTPLEWFIGKGPATFMVWGPRLQRDFNIGIPNGWFIYMHSDILENVFNVGIPLTIAAIISGVALFIKADKTCRIALLAFLAGVPFYYPFRFPAHLLVFFFLVRVIMGDKWTKRNSGSIASQ